jgi:PD-(D/E)XK endonuclease
MRERLINRSQQGALGEASAIEWLTRQGATVSAPLGHSPDYDLIAELDGRLVRVQVKTGTCQETTPRGAERWQVAIRTNGGNQSWNGTTKWFEPDRVDALFVLVGDGRRWHIPSAEVEATNTIRLGGPKYSEYEIEPTSAILPIVYGTEGARSTIDRPNPGERRSGRAGLGCKPSAPVLSGFESLLPHPAFGDPEQPPDRRPPKFSRTRISPKHQITVPSVPFAAAGLAVGDRLHLTADGPGRIVLERIDPPPG